MANSWRCSSLDGHYRGPVCCVLGWPMPHDDPHAGQPVLTAGPPPADARLTMILVHGRNATAEKILPVGIALQLDDVAFVVPQAAGNTWYPQSFLAPIEQNEPGISSGLRMLSHLVESLKEQGVESTRIGLLG